jgi:hypothetical protein
MTKPTYFYLIGMGNEQDWQAGRGSIYYVEDRNGEKAVPVFTTSERVQKYIVANFGNPQAHMDMIESLPKSHIQPLTEGRFSVIPLKADGVAQVVAAMLEADYLVRDPRPGDEQEILRLT